MFTAEHDVDDHRKDRRFPRCLEVEALQPHETPDVLVARRRNAEFACDVSEFPSYLGERGVGSRKRCEVFPEPCIESGRRGGHLFRLAYRQFAECERSVSKFAL